MRDVELKIDSLKLAYYLQTSEHIKTEVQKKTLEIYNSAKPVVDNVKKIMEDNYGNSAKDIDKKRKLQLKKIKKHYKKRSRKNKTQKELRKVGIGKKNNASLKTVKKTKDKEKNKTLIKSVSALSPGRRRKMVQNRSIRCEIGNYERGKYKGWNNRIIGRIVISDPALADTSKGQNTLIQAAKEAGLIKARKKRKPSKRYVKFKGSRDPQNKIYKSDILEYSTSQPELNND